MTDDHVAQPKELLEGPSGNFRVLPLGPAYCTGIVPRAGFEVVRVQLRSWLPLDDAYPFIERYLESVGRPMQDFCGIEMRVPAPLTRADWTSFNTPYLAWLRRWGLMHGDQSLVCRSNIALAMHPPATASVCAFSYVAPGGTCAGGFCLSGTADITPEGRIIAEGDTGPEAMRERARYTIDVISGSLAALGLSWTAVNQVALFHVADIPDLWGPALLGGLGATLRQGVVVYRARPPIVGGEVELEARGAQRDQIVDTA